MGVIMAGGVYCSANPAFTARELGNQLTDADVSVMLAARANLACALEGAQMVGLLLERVFVFEEAGLHGKEPDYEIGDVSRDMLKQPLHWKSLLAARKVGERFRWEELRTSEEVSRTCILIYSSGTTGLPKGVELSHYNIVANMCQLYHMQTLDRRFVASTTNSPRMIGFLPMYHALGMIYYGFVAPKRGLQVYLMDRFELFRMMENIQRFRITELLLVPPVLVAMAKHPAIRGGKYDLSSVMKVVCGAAPLGREATALFEELWPDRSIKVRQAWGMSE